MHHETEVSGSGTDLNIEVSVVPNQATRVALTPDKAGEFNFLCTVFCGEGHENMVGKVIVE
jgi:cytochrome c oxidase subunit 2